METVEQIVEAIRSRNTTITIEGDKIIASRPLLPDEREFMKANRADVITYIRATPAPAAETAEAAYNRGWLDGVKHATEELGEQAKMNATEKPQPTPKTPEHEIERFEKWMAARTNYYRWEPESLEALRAALQPGDRVQPMFAYSCLIVHPNGTESEFRRVSKKKS
jgi:hypothetical protein